MMKMYTVLVFVVLKICGSACYDNTTGIHSEQDRYEMQVYGVSSEPSVEKYPVEKISVPYLKSYLELCLNGTVIRNKLCDPYVTYNTRLIENNVIPFFSDVNIYFIDEDNLCTSSFKAYVQTYNNVIRIEDIYRFLTNQTSCLDKIYFTNQINIEFSLQNISNTQSIIFAYTHTYATDIYFILKYQTCKEQLIHSLYTIGFHVSKDDKFLLSFDNLMNLTQENACYETYLTCRIWGRYQDRFVILPHSTIVYGTSTVALAVILVNGFVLSIFLQKDNRTPVTILLSALAISDSMTTLLTSVRTLIAYHKYGHHVYNYNEELQSRWILFDISECLLYIVTSGLMYSFHFVSILLTTLLCLQKTVALLFPMWSKSKIRNRRNVICSISIFIFSFCIFSATVSVEILSHAEPINGRCCIDLEYISHGYYVNLYFYTIVTGSAVLACLVVIVCTIYITCKLTIMRRNLPWTDSSIIQKRNRTSALTVVVICIIFLLSEAVFIVRMSAFSLSKLEILNAMSLYIRLTKYNDICLVIGFSLNFVIYLLMSRQIRDKIRIGFVKLFQSFKCW